MSGVGIGDRVRWLIECIGWWLAYLYVVWLARLIRAVERDG